MAVPRQKPPIGPKSKVSARKFCFITGCRNTNMRFPNLVFFDVPLADEETKKTWLTVAKRQEHINNRLARWYCCEEHFNLEQDADNYEEYKLYGVTPVLKKDVAPHILPNNEPTLPVPKKANFEEWDKFKRRLIRAVARLLYKEKKPENEVWAFLKKETGCDCLLLWDRMRSLTLKKMSRLLLADDRGLVVPVVARMTITDWLMCDLVLVHEDIDVIGRTEEVKPPTRDHRALIQLFSIVQRFNVEELEGESLALAWSAAAKYYNTDGKQCSMMLLQRRWYQMKEWTRIDFYKFWQAYRGNKAKFEAIRDTMPGKLQRAIARRFPQVITEEFEDWEKQITWETVILPEHFESLANRELPAPREDDDPDLILLEPVIETIEVDSDGESNTRDTEEPDGASSSNLEEPNEISTMEDCGFDPSKVKDEPIDNIDIVENEIDKNEQLLMSTAEALEEINHAFKESETDTIIENIETGIDIEVTNAKETETGTDGFGKENTCAVAVIDSNATNEDDSNIETDENNKVNEDEVVETTVPDVIESMETDIKQDQDIKTGINNIESFDETAQCGFESQMPMITNVFGNIDTKELSNFSAKLIENSTEDSKEVDHIETNELLKSPRLNENLPEVNYIDDEDDEDTVEDIIKINVDDFPGVKNLEDVVQIKNKSSLSGIEAKVDNSSVAQSVCGAELDDFDESSVSLSLADEGIALMEHADCDVIEPNDDDIDLIKVGSQQSERNNEKTEPYLDSQQKESEETPKFDLKLLMEPLVYTTKVDQMSSLRNKDLTTVYLQSILENILIESKPVSKRSITFMQQTQDKKELNCIEQTKVKLENSEFENDHNNKDLIKRGIEEEDENTEFEIKNEITDKIRVKPTSYLLQKPKSRQYGPIQICKNPDFNTRLKRLSMGFYNYERNIQFLNMCKPMTVDLHKAFETRLVDGTLYLKPSEISNSTEATKPVEISHETANISFVPFAGPVQSLMNVPLPTAEELAPPPPAVDEDVVQVNWLDRPMPQPCILAIKPTAPLSTPAPNHNLFSSLDPPPSKNPNEDTEKQTKAAKEKAKNKPRPKPNPVPNWISQRLSNNRINKLDEYLIASDTLTKMLLMMSGSSDGSLPYNKFKKAKKKYDYSKPMNKVVKEKSPGINNSNSAIDDKRDSVTVDITEDATEVENTSKEPPRKISTAIQTDNESIDLDDDTSKKGKQQKNKKYCCWARRKIITFGKKNYFKHKCPLDVCICCCMEEFQMMVNETRTNTVLLEKPIENPILPKPSISQPEPAVLQLEASMMQTEVPSLKSTEQSYSKPVAHIKIVTKPTSPPHSLQSNILSSQCAKVAQVRQVVRKQRTVIPCSPVKKKPSLVIDGTSRSVLIAKGSTQSPIYLGKNKILLTTLKFPSMFDEVPPETVQPPKVISNIQLPPGVQLVLLPNGCVTFTVDPNANLTPEQLEPLPAILAAVQEQFAKGCTPDTSSLPKIKENNNSVNVTDEIVISDDEKPSDEINQTSATEKQIDKTLEPANDLMLDQPVENIVDKEVQNKTADNTESNRKSLLSDLMEMSGISFEDTLPQSQPAAEQLVEVQNDSMMLPSHNVNISINTVTPEDNEVPANVVPNIITSDGSVPVNVTNSVAAPISEDTVLDDVTPVPAIVPVNIETLRDAAIATPKNGLDIDGNLEPSVLQSEIVPEKNILSSNIEETASMPKGSNDLTGSTLYASQKEFSVVTSFAKLKYVCDKKGKFFKLDLDTGLVVPINVCLKKKSQLLMSNNTKTPNIETKHCSIETQDIDLTEENLPTFVLRKNAMKNLDLNQSNTPIAGKSTTPRPLKLFRAVRSVMKEPPGILRKRNLLRENLVSTSHPDSLVVVKQKRKERLMARLVSARSKPMQIEILDSEDETDDTALQKAQSQQDMSQQQSESDSSDDEPLSKIAKRIHDPNDTERENTSPILTNSELTPNIIEQPNKGISQDEERNKSMDTEKVAETNENRESIETAVPMEIDLPSEVNESDNTVLNPEHCFFPAVVPQFPQEEFSDSDSEDCILGV